MPSGKTSFRRTKHPDAYEMGADRILPSRSKGGTRCTVIACTSSCGTATLPST